MADFDIIPIEVVRGHMFREIGTGIRGWGPLLGEEISWVKVVWIGMILKSAKTMEPYSSTPAPVTLTKPNIVRK
jgi:hypothetical protein